MLLRAHSKRAFAVRRFSNSAVSRPHSLAFGAYWVVAVYLSLMILIFIDWIVSAFGEWVAAEDSPEAF